MYGRGEKKDAERKRQDVVAEEPFQRDFFRRGRSLECHFLSGTNLRGSRFSSCWRPLLQFLRYIRIPAQHYIPSVRDAWSSWKDPEGPCSQFTRATPVAGTGVGL